MNVIDLDYYRATRRRIEYGDDLGRALHEIDKELRECGKCLTFPKRPTKAERTIWNSWWGPWPPRGAA